MKKLEYKTIEVQTSGFMTQINVEETDKILNETGQEGWELVSTVPCTIGGGTTRLYYTFKREIV